MEKEIEHLFHEALLQLTNYNRVTNNNINAHGFLFNKVDLEMLIDSNILNKYPPVKINNLRLYGYRVYGTENLDRGLVKIII